jgi:hypothetical protein
MNDILKKLQAPFHPDRIEWRLGSCGKKQDGSFWGKALCYITQRAAFERLDEVFGSNWSIDEKYQTVGSGSVCVVTVSVREKDVERKVTGSCQVEFDKAGDIDPFKTASSGALKRAVVSLGVGRYLYDLEEGWAVIASDGAYQGKTRDKESFRWNPPALPIWALPEGYKPEENKKKVATFIPEQEEFVPTARFIPNESAQQPVNLTVTPFGSSDPLDAVIHFGKNKGNSLRTLSKKSLQWYIEEYKAEGYNGRPPRKEDLDLRAALDKVAGTKTMSAPAPAQAAFETEDNVPF